MDADDPRIRDAIRYALAAVSSGRLTKIEAEAHLIAALAEPSPEAVMAEYERLLPKHGRSTATLVARKFATDPTEVESLAKKLRRWKKNAQCPNPRPETE
jgi:hypothetical protein